MTAGGVFEHDEIVNKFFNEELGKYNAKADNKIKRIPLIANSLDGALVVSKQ